MYQMIPALAEYPGVVMRVTEEQKANAAVRSVEAKKRAKAAPLVDWTDVAVRDAAVERLKKMLAELYRPKRTRQKQS